MKIRSGFVSNSSSSSFIIINNIDSDYNEKEFKQEYSQYVRDNKFHYVALNDFGWEFEEFDSLHDKFDWVCFFAIGNKEREEVLLKFLRETINNDIEVLDIENSCSVDHQSITEDNARMLNSVSVLKDFMFSNYSKIYTGNDNSSLGWFNVSYYGLDDYDIEVAKSIKLDKMEY